MRGIFDQLLIYGALALEGLLALFHVVKLGLGVAFSALGVVIRRISRGNKQLEALIVVVGIVLVILLLYGLTRLIADPEQERKKDAMAQNVGNVLEQLKKPKAARKGGGAGGEVLTHTPERVSAEEAAALEREVAQRQEARAEAANAATGGGGADDAGVGPRRVPSGEQGGAGVENGMAGAAPGLMASNPYARWRDKGEASKFGRREELMRMRRLEETARGGEHQPADPKSQLLIMGLRVGVDLLEQRRVFAQLVNASELELVDAVVTVHFHAADGRVVFSKAVNPLVISGGLFGDAVNPLPPEQRRGFSLAMDDVSPTWQGGLSAEITSAEFKE